MERAIDASELMAEIQVCSWDSEQDRERAEDLVLGMPTLTPPNEPLSIGQLREMDGEPVWLDVADGVWALVDTDDDCVWLDRGGSIDIYKLTGKVYRHPPEGEADGE